MQLTNGDDLLNTVRNAPIGICILDAATLTAEMVNDKFLEVAGKPYDQIFGKFYWDAFAEARAYYESALSGVVRTGEAFYANEVELMLIRHGKEEMVFVTFVYSPVKDKDGKVSKVAVWVLENTKQVNERQKMEAARVASQQERDRLKSFFMQAPAGICILDGPELVYELVNPAYQALLPGRKLLGRPIFEALPELVGTPLQDVLLNVYRTGEPFEINELLIPIAEYEGGPTQDRYFTFNYQARRDENDRIDGILAFVFEVTGMMNVQQDLSEARELSEQQKRVYETITSATPDLMYVFGLDYRFTYANSALLTMWGKTWENAIGKSLLENGYEPWHAEMHEREIDQVKATKQPIRGEVSFPHATLGRRVYDYIFTPVLNEQGEVEAVAGTTRDITERKLWEETLAQSSEELQATNEEMASANEELVTTNEELSENKETLQKLLDELAASESQTRSIVEAAPFPIGVYIGREMRIMFANRSIIDVWGKGRDVIGRLYADILPELDNQAIFAQLDEVFTTGIPFEARNQRLDLVVDGEVKTSYFNYNFTPLTNEAGQVYGVMNTGADVTDVALAKEAVEKASEALASMNEELAAINEELNVANEEQVAVNQELAEVNDKYKHAQDELLLAINAASLATFDLDPATGKFSGNDLLKSWFGLQREDEIELNKATGVIVEADRERVLKAIEQALTFEHGGDYDTHYTILNPLDPVPRIVRAKGKVLFNERHQPTRLSGVIQDVTEQKRDEQRKNDFIGMVSHELKTPLTSLTAIVQVLNSKLKNNEDSFIAGALDKANIQVKKMSTLINGFLNISRLESGKIQMDKKEFRLDDLTSTVIEETRLTSPGYTINLNHCDTVNIIADQEKIGSVISNLLSNAVKYSPQKTPIGVGCKVSSKTVEISVKDEGIGIAAKDIAYLFDRYYRVDDPNHSHISGFGIGLYLSSEIVRQHGGQIWVESETGKGSTFYFTLPIR